MSFRKLTLAILVVGLVFAFVGTAFTGVTVPPPEKANKYNPVVSTKAFPANNAPGRTGSAGLYKTAQPTALDPDAEKNSSMPQTNSPDTTGCTLLNFYDGGTTWDWIYGIAGGSLGRVLAMRYDSPLEDHIAAKVYGVYPYVWWNNNDEGASLPLADLVVTLYEDEGGLPGDVIISEPFTLPEFNYGDGQYFALEFTGGPIDVPPVFHVGLSATGGDANSALIVGSDDGGADCIHPVAEIPGTALPTGRSTAYLYDDDLETWDWYMGDVAFACGDRNFDFYVDICSHYTACYYTHELPPPGYIWWRAHPDDGVRNFGAAWSDGSIWNGVAQRTTFVGDTLAFVRVSHIDYSIAGYAAYGPVYGNISWPATGGHDIIVEIWEDNLGEMDLSGPIATRTIDGSVRSNIYPATGGDGTAAGWNHIYVDFRAENFTMSGTYHTSIRMSTDDPANGWLITPFSDEDPADFGTIYWTDGTGASVRFSSPGDGWKTMPTHSPWYDDTELDLAYYQRLYFCVDEFSECDRVQFYLDPYDPEWSYDWWTGGSIHGFAERLEEGNPVNRIEMIRVWTELDPESTGPDDADVVFKIWADNNAGPVELNLVWSQAVPCVTGPGWTTVVIPGGVQCYGKVWIGYERDHDQAAADDCFYGYTEDTELAFRGDNGCWINYNPTEDPPGWMAMSDWEYQDNLIMEVDFCAIPVQERPCFAERNMPMFGMDMFRTGASTIELGDPDCDLNLEWHFFGRGGANRNAPVIYDGMVVMGLSTGYVVLDLATGAEVAFLDYGSMGINTRGTPMVVNTTIDDPADPGTDITCDIILCPTASTWRVTAYKWGTWEWVWSSALSGASVRYANFVVLSDVLYYSNENAELLAVNLYDGQPFAGWDGVGGSIDLGLNCVLAGCTDGTSLFFGTIDLTEGDPGDIYMVDPADGAILEQFTTNNDLEVPDYWDWITPEDNTEGFTGSMSWDAMFGLLYANSDCNGAAQESGFDPPDGVYYAIEIAGAEPYMTTATSAYGQRTLYTGPIIDYLRVIVPTNSVWVQTPLEGNVLSFRRPQGDADYVGAFPTYEAGFMGQPALSCEEGVRDILAGGCGGSDAYYDGGFLAFFNADNGERMFYRKTETGNADLDVMKGVSLGVASVAIDPEAEPIEYEDVTYLVTADFMGSVFGFKHGSSDRPRLEIQDHLPQVNVSFGSAIVPMEFTDILFNSGCATLNIWSIAIDPDTEAPGTSTPDFSSNFEGVRSDVAAAASSIATRLTSSRGGKVNELDAFEVGTDDLFARAAKTEDVSRKAAVITDMAWLVGYPGTPLTYPSMIGQKAYGSIGFSVDQAQLDRGPHEFFLTIDCDDPDYFINDVSGKVPLGYPPGVTPTGYQGLKPRIFANVVGGCISDTTTLHFGMNDGENRRLVYNSARLGTGDYAVSEGGVGNFLVDGLGSELYAGSYIYGINKYRLAMNARDWTEGGGETNGFYGAQGDPNWCDNDCKPAMLTDVVMGKISSDGTLYSDVVGMMSGVSHVDSVFGYYDAGDAVDDYWTWDAGWETGRMDDTLTIGLSCDMRTFGAINVEQLSNVMLDVMDFTERNGNEVNGWYFGAYGDGDIGNDISAYDEGISTGWQHGAGSENVTAFTKIPFGPGYAPALGGVQMFGHQGLWDSDPYYDSAYMWMSNDGGTADPSYWGQCVIHPITGDAQFHHTLAGHDFDGYGTLRFAVGISILHGLVDGELVGNGYDLNQVAPSAHLLNKWAGFGRGDVDNDNVLTIGDIVYLNRYTYDSEHNPGPVPFMHLGDVDNDDDVDADDVLQLKDYIINFNPAAAPVNDWAAWTSTGCP